MTQQDAPFSEMLAAAVDTAGGSVVRVEGRRGRPASGTVWASDGTIVTTDHALGDDDQALVTLADGRELTAAVVGRDPTTDLAVLRVGASDLSVPAWRELEGLRVGHAVLALGRPGRTVRARFGILGAAGGEWRTPYGATVARYLEPDVARAPGFSGGVLTDASGRAIGVNTAGLLRGTVVTVAGPDLRRVVDSLVAHGRIRRGYLGIAAQRVRLPRAAQTSEQRSGLLVLGVEPDSPAERGGVLLGDTLTAVGGQPVRRFDDLLGALGEDRIGTAVSIRVLRAGQVLDLSVSVGERPRAA